MVTKYYCDVCKREVESKYDLKTICVHASVTDQHEEDGRRSITSLTVEVCRKCQIKNEPTLKSEIDGLLNLLEAS